MAVLLSICIPTYNRINSLRCLLRSIYECNADVALETYEVVVTDNCSTDNTIELLRQYWTEFSNFSYAVNDKNIGAIPNFRKCLQLAKGEFVWLVGSDDLLVNGSLRQVMSTLECSQNSVILLNYYSWYPSLQEQSVIFDTNDITEKVNVEKHRPVDGEFLLDFLSIHDQFLTAMYCFIIKSTKWEQPFSTYNFNKHPFSTAKNCSAHIFDIVPSVHNEKCSYISQPSIVASFNIGWLKYYPLFYCICVPEIYQLYRKYELNNVYATQYLLANQGNNRQFLRAIAKDDELYKIFSPVTYLNCQVLKKAAAADIRDFYVVRIKYKFKKVLSWMKSSSEAFLARTR